MLHTARAFGIALLVASTAGYASAQRSYAGSTSTFSLTQKTQVPGGTLKPGQYSIQIVDQLSDRMIVRIDSSTGSDHTMFLGIPHNDFAEASSVGPVPWKSGLEGSEVLRGFEFASGSTVEFVYPKTEAVALAKLNAAKVVAVDPESEGRPILKKMSHDDMQVITLWTLSLTSTGPDAKTPAIQAQRYVGDSGANSTVARNTLPSQPSASSTPPAQVASVEQPQPVAQSAQTAAPKSHHVIARLPHTASSLPAIWITGLCSLLLVGMLRFGRLIWSTRYPEA